MQVNLHINEIRVTHMDAQPIRAYVFGDDSLKLANARL